MTKELEKDYTYVLFGNEAIKLFNMSLNFLLSSTDIHFKVGAYNDVKKFVSESKNWDAFKEISESDYLRLKKHIIKSPLHSTSNKKRKRFSFLNLFK